MNNDKKRYKSEETTHYVKYTDEDLKPAEREYKQKFRSLLKYEDNVDNINIQAFCPKHTDEDRERAVKFALEEVEKRKLEQREERTRQQSSGIQSDSDGDSIHSYPGCARSQNNDPLVMSTGEKKFFRKLKDCLPLTTGFDIEGSEGMDIKNCYCPCGGQMEKWWSDDRDVSLLFDGKDFKKSPCRHFGPLGLMAHLEKEGETCILHYGTRKYLEKLYENHNGPGMSSTYIIVPLW